MAERLRNASEHTILTPESPSLAASRTLNTHVHIVDSIRVREGEFKLKGKTGHHLPGETQGIILDFKLSPLEGDSERLHGPVHHFWPGLGYLAEAHVGEPGRSPGFIHQYGLNRRC